MKPSAIATALLSFVSAALASATPETQTSKVILPADFKPPQVFKNANLVHVISLEKNYVKEQINVLVENVASEPQTEYYVPFTADQLPRVGGFEVKDRKDASAGTFATEVVEYDPLSDVQYYRIQLPTPLKPGAQQTLGITFYYLKAYYPLPAAVPQDENQFLAYDFSVYAPSAYPTLKQKTEVKAISSSIPDYTKLPGNGDVKEFPVKQGAKLTYGPFDEKPAGAVSPARVRFEYTKPVTHVKELERDIEVSHWGGNVAFGERYDLYHRGANLSTLFNRVKWAQAQFYNPPTHALKELRVPLQVGSVDAYFVDTIGNVSTSRFRTNRREALLELKPRYPLFGGWKYPFTIGWNSDAANFVRKTATGGYVLKVPFLEGPKQPEGVEYEHINVRVVLPEGAENVKFYTNIPESAITSTSIDLTKTYLDTVGRTTVTIKARNLVDEFRDRQLIISYDAPLSSALRKPLVIFVSHPGSKDPPPCLRLASCLASWWWWVGMEMAWVANPKETGQDAGLEAKHTFKKDLVLHSFRVLHPLSLFLLASLQLNFSPTYHPQPSFKSPKMCFRTEPKTKYYYHEEIVPARRHHGHHHHHHHHSHSRSPRASYTSVTRRSYSHSPRTSGRVVYESRYV
ncbi:oligosaccharyl transferase complex subunit ost4 [Fusarium albosuccineum]|uniref:Dolichyl-diphosphooligosaccharide--protein glycosyltransferase subunit 1 n=1 Tax=Fusarium albosuccineum TaxID=1237068 RepID=A0A8H4LIK2_9HYPO|nr:oligosaccharyl transferase complex subunit ost4 [Fusarium albosuccineum]